MQGSSVDKKIATPAFLSLIEKGSMPKQHSEETPDEDEEEEEGEGEPETAYETGSRRCLRCCCLLLLVLFLACILAGNLAYIVAPKSFSDFLCSLGIYAQDNSSLADDEDAANRSLLELPVEEEAFGRSIFDVRHPESDDLLFSDIEAQLIDDYEKEPDNDTEPAAGCNSSSSCSLSTRKTSAHVISTESILQGLADLDDGVVPPQFSDYDEEAFNTLDFDSFLDTAAVTRRSIAVTPSIAELQTPRNYTPAHSRTNPSALRDLLARFPQPSRGRFSKTPPRVAYVWDGNLTQLDSTEVHRPAVTLEEFRLPTVPVTNTRLLLFQKAFRYSGKTASPAIFDLNRILPNGRVTFDTHHTL
ncbi:hypothetical protein V5799_023164 [Amblyomma americanum]|uniref:Uncharacterized protein n=1 Tax=Amblyomma americanum TaxID=6943 RepID=A0AAQ4FIK5_AMBAM